jgi:dienelactone hydrolase
MVHIILCLTLAVASSCAAADAGPWDMKTLRQAPKFTVVERKDNLSSIYYDGEPYQGKPTRVFAYLAYPEGVKGRSPAIVLVHGGAGRAFADWARMWASRGYVALAMDHFGQGPDGKHASDGGPDINGTIFPHTAQGGWTYSAIAAVVRGVSLVSSLPEVDPKRIGITGVSWGGYLTCIVAGIDDRIKAAAPIYGCGYLHEASMWSSQIQALPEDQRRVWIDSLDPSCYLGNAKAPMLFINGTNDHCFWLDSYQKSYQLVRRRVVCIRKEMPHDQNSGASPVDISIFMDQHLKGGVGLPELGKPKCSGGSVEASFKSPAPVRSAEIVFTTDTGAWEQRKWQSLPAKIDRHTIKADLPAGRPLAYYISLTDTRGASVTTEHETLK